MIEIMANGEKTAEAGGKKTAGQRIGEGFLNVVLDAVSNDEKLVKSAHTINMETLVRIRRALPTESAARKVFDLLEKPMIVESHVESGIVSGADWLWSFVKSVVSEDQPEAEKLKDGSFAKTHALVARARGGVAVGVVKVGVGVGGVATDLGRGAGRWLRERVKEFREAKLNRTDQAGRVGLTPVGEPA